MPVTSDLAGMNTVIQHLFTKLSQLFHTNLLTIGQNSISLGSILKLILSLVIVIVISRGINRFLKRKLLLKLGIDEGNREAIATIITYSVSTLGFIVVLQIAGFNLASLAVLAGGLGIGIGFALQNISADFISGLTLLIERSVKIGDFVELQIQELKGIEGIVKAISLRATILQKNDGSIFVIPNSKLMENPILNWRHDHSNSRISIPVKVSCDSDPLKVTETLLNSAYMESSVKLQPTPQVIFAGVGEISSDFELRVWINQIDKAADIKSSLNFIIDYNFRQQKISRHLTKPDKIQNITALTEQQSVLQVEQSLSLSDLLRQVTYFQNFTDLDLRQLIEIGYRKRLRNSEILFRENQPGDAFYIILNGSVEIFVEKINKHLTTLTKGKFFGELALMLGIPRTATVRALEDTTLFVINNKGFQKLLKGQPELAEEIVQELGKHQDELVSRQQQLREMGLVDAAEDDTNPVAWVRKRLQKLFSL